MQHYIIVKFNENAEKEKIINPIKELFKRTNKIKEIKKLEIFESNMNLPNRYDLMIKMELSQKALNEFDNSDIHKEWKEKFENFIMSKTIFDCD